MLRFECALRGSPMLTIAGGILLAIAVIFLGAAAFWALCGS